MSILSDLITISALTLVLHNAVIGTGAINNAVVFRLSAIGLLEVRYEGKWGKICAANFDTRAAGPMCKQMGYMDTGHKIDYSGTPLTDIVVHSITCTGTTIDSCTFTPSNGNNKCRFPILALRLICKPKTDVHLIKTESNAHSGIVEISRGTQRGVICADSEKVAKLVCTHMGYSGGANEPAAEKPADYTEKVFDVVCSTTSLDHCTITEKASCNQVQRVQCQVDSASQTIFKVKLSISSHQDDKSYGTVDIYQYGKWGVICDTGWDSRDADVVCRQLGYKNSLATTGFPKEAYYGQGTGVVFWNNVKCTGDEPSIEQCPHDVVWGTRTCNSVNAAGVRCSGEKLPRFDFCTTVVDVNITIPKGVSFLLSPGYPKTFSYKNGTTCSCSPADPRTSGTLSAYVNQKRFTGNKVEYLTLMNGGDPYKLYGEDPTAGPFESSVQNFLVEFRTNDIGTNGEGMFRIQLKGSESVNLSCKKTVDVPGTSTSSSAPVASGTTVTSSPPKNTEIASAPVGGVSGAAGGIIGSIFVLVCVTILGIVLWKLGFIRFGKNRRDRQYELGTQGSAEVSTPPRPTGGHSDDETNVTERHENLGGQQNDAFVYDETRPNGDAGAEAQYVNVSYINQQVNVNNTVDSEYANGSFAGRSQGNDGDGGSTYASLDTSRQEPVYLDLHQGTERV